MKKVLLVGGFGFIGKNLIENLYNEFEIIVIGRKIDLKFIEKYNKIRFYKYDFLIDNEIKQIIKSINPNYIINLVSIVGANRDMGVFRESIDLNIEVLLKLYDASKNLKNLDLFLQFGSGEEYGNIEAPFSEETREYPSSPYAISKQLTTNIALMLHNNFAFPISVVRPGNLFGKYQDSDKFIPYLLDNLSNNLDINTTHGEQERDFIYAEDFAVGIKRALNFYNKFKGQIFNLSSGKSYKLKHIIEYIKDYLGSKSKINYGVKPYRENEMMTFKLDISKFEELTEEKFEIDLIKSISKYIDKKGENFQ
jgi:UDP-glucose 4-epimerase